MIRDLARGAIRRTLLSRQAPVYEPDGQRIWLIRPDHLGDLLFLRPGLKRLRRKLPGWQITLMLGPWSREVVADDPNVDEIVEFPFPGFTRESNRNPAEPYRLLFEAASLIREARPQCVVVLRDDHWWGALAARQAGVPLIVGSEHPVMDGMLTDRVAVASMHSVECNAELLDRAAARLGSTIDMQPVNLVDDRLRWTIHNAD